MYDITKKYIAHIMPLYFFIYLAELIYIIKCTAHLKISLYKEDLIRKSAKILEFVYPIPDV